MIMAFFRYLKKHLIPFGILFIISFIFIFPYLKRGFILASGEMSTYLNPKLYNYFSLWEDKYNFGFFSPHQQNIFLFSYLWNICSFLFWFVHPSISITFVFYFLSSVFFYFCLDALVNLKNKLYYLPATLLYTFNVYKLLGPLNERVNLLFLYLPLFFWFYVKLIHKKKWLYVFLLLSLSIISSPLGGNLPLLLIPYILMLLYLIYYLVFLTKNPDWRWLVKSHLVLFILILLGNLFWMRSIYIYNLAALINTKNGTDMFSALSSGSFSDHFRFLGSWAWRSGTGNYAYYPYAPNFDSFFFLLTTYSIPFLIISNYIFFHVNRNRIISYFMLFLMIVSLTLLAGSKGPFTAIYNFMYNYLPVFRMYREPYAKFMPLFIFAYSFILIFFIENISHRLKRHFFYLFLILISFVILLNAYPLFTTGAIAIKKWNEVRLSYLVKIPDYWGQMKTQIENDKLDDHLLVTPYNLYSSVHLWEYGIGLVGNAADYLIDKPLYHGTDRNNSASTLIINNIFTNQNYSFPLKPYLSLLNTKYILQENDLDTRSAEEKVLPPSLSNQFLTGQGLTNIKNVGYFSSDQINNLYQQESNPIWKQQIKKELTDIPALQLYQVDDAYFLPHFYVPNKIITFYNSVEKLPKLVASRDFAVGDAFYFNKQNSGQNINLDILNNTVQKPIIEFKKISQTKYRLVFHQAKEDFPLVFSENYQPYWQLYLTNLPINNYRTSLNNSDYYAFRGNENDQATLAEVNNFLKKGWISTLGKGKERQTVYYTYTGGVKTISSINKYKTDFISKNIFGVIQNNNLPDNLEFETWLKSPLKNTNHVIFNGYANGWIIKPALICEQSSLCQKNNNGSYDLSLIVEFSYQKYFLIALSISLSILAISLIIIIFLLTKKTSPLRPSLNNGKH